MFRLRLPALLVVLALAGAACTSGDDSSSFEVEIEAVDTFAADPDDVDIDDIDDTDDTGIESDDSEIDDAEIDDTGLEDSTTQLEPDGGAVDVAVDVADDQATRDDVACDADGLGSDDTAQFVVANYVVDGRLGAVCFGDPDSDDARVVADAWQRLATIAPQGQLGDLGVFGGFVGADQGDEVTLAFVNPLDDDGTLFQMSINIDESVEDPEQLMLTMAHEFTHVFTALETQLDRTDEAIDLCDTYYNGEGCYLPDSLMYAWIQEFWGGGLIDEVDPDAEADYAQGQDRCDRDPSFFGAYAASNPEEDFAESFSAFVFRVDAATDAQQAKLDWIGLQPGLAEFRDRAIEADLGPVENRFDPCG